MNSSQFPKGSPPRYGWAENSKLRKSQFASKVRTYQREDAAAFEKRLLQMLRAASSILSRNLPRDLNGLVPLIESPIPVEVAEQAANEAHLIAEGLTGELLRYLQRHPEGLQNLPGHLFEELLAELLYCLGFDEISLRVPTNAGEVDILGFSKDVLGHRIGYVFELKQRGQSRKPVELREITRLYGLRESLRLSLGVDQGVFVTTTSYTQPARQFASIHRLALKDLDEVITWLASYQESASGLFLRATPVGAAGA